MNNITFREIKKSDYKELEKIICDTWNYKKFCSPKTAKALSRLYLATCLANQSFTCTALCNDVPVGVIMGKNENTHRLSLKFLFKQVIDYAAMLFTAEGRYVLNMFKGFDEINQNLFAQSTISFGGEIAFFAVNSNQRGNGIGKLLFERLKVYMASQNISNFYLYTDSSCNYGFYEHQGMKRISEKACELKAYNKEMSFFMYGYSLA